MQSVVLPHAGRAAVVAALVFMGMPSAKSATIVDGGFEPPNPTASPGANTGYVLVSPGSSFGGPSNNAWTVIDPNSTGAGVAVTHAQEYNPIATPQYYNANSGSQWLDLTGTNDQGAKIGVAQSVATIVGAFYSVSFYIGNFNSQPQSSVELLIDGAHAQTFTNTLAAPNTPVSGPGGPGVNVIAWALYTYDFAATGSSTLLGFLNATPVGLSQAGVGLDDVSISEIVPGQTPIPGAAFLMGSILAGGAGFGAWRRRKVSAA